jgi:hypothetical protein
VILEKDAEVNLSTIGFKLGLIASTLIWGEVLFAKVKYRQFEVREEISLFPSPASRESLQELNPGDIVQIGDRSENEKRRVRSQAKPFKFLGYIDEEDLLFGEFLDDLDESLEVSASLQRSSFLSIFVSESYYSQRSYVFATDTSLTIGPLTGVSPYFGFHYDLPLQGTRSQQFGLLLRKIEVTGPGVFNTGASSQVALTQDFIGISWLQKNYLSTKGSFWLGWGGEVSIATKVIVDLGDGASEGSSLPFYTHFQLAGGWSYQLTQRIHLLTESKLGAVVNKSPLIGVGEIHLGLALSL